MESLCLDVLKSMLMVRFALPCLEKGGLEFFSLLLVHAEEFSLEMKW
jgi:hypothetical protein